MNRWITCVAVAAGVVALAAATASAGHPGSIPAQAHLAHSAPGHGGAHGAAIHQVHYGPRHHGYYYRPVPRAYHPPVVVVPRPVIVAPPVYRSYYYHGHPGYHYGYGHPHGGFFYRSPGLSIGIGF
jgi:hypothetical protein